MIYQSILDASIAGSTLALTSIAYSLHKLTTSRKFKEGGIESDLSACQGAIRDIRLIREDLIQEQIDEIDERREAKDGY